MFNITCRSLTESTEHCIWASPSKSGFYFDYEYSRNENGGIQLRNVWKSPVTPARERVGHPNQKPKWLYNRIVRMASPVDGLVLDPMCGSGVTAIVCEGSGRNCICIEKNPEYHKMAEKGLKECRAGQLF